MNYNHIIALMIFIIMVSGCSKELVTHAVITELGEEEIEAPLEEEIPPPEPITVNETETETIEETTPEEEVEETEEETTTEEPKEETQKVWTITIESLKLHPQELTIKKGDTVKWLHEDKWQETGQSKHMLYAHLNEFRSPVFYYGESFNYTFDEVGEYTYADIFYRERSYMRGKIIVTE